MTAQDTYNEMKFDEAEARGRRIVKLEAIIKELEAENDQLREELRKRKPKVGPPQHPGQVSIYDDPETWPKRPYTLSGTEEAK